MRSGVCSTPTKWVPRIDVAASLSLLPTPNASCANYSEDPKSWRERRAEWLEKRQYRAGLPLAIAVKELFQTPTASDMKGSVPPREGREKGAGKLTEQIRLLPTPRARFGTSGPDARVRDNGPDLFVAIERATLLPTPTASDMKGSRNLTCERGEGASRINPGTTLLDATRDWGKYQPAIDQWAFLLGRPAPEPLKGRQLNAAFVEWMMGLEEGWVSELVENRPSLKVLGNGVMPQQAIAALLELQACDLVRLHVASACLPGERQSPPTIPTEGATLNTPTIRRARGRLEDLVREVCDQIVTGAIELPEELPWTPHRLAAQIKERYPASGVDPSTGAIADNLKRWAGLGFAVVEESPLAFVAYTDEGREKGLAVLKQEARERRSQERREAKAATTAESEAQAV